MLLERGLVHKFKREYIAFNNDNIVSAIKSYAGPGEKMAVWGWSYAYYVKSNLVMATRTPMDVFCSGQFKSLQSYFLAAYAQELEQSKAAILLDTVAPGQFWFQDRNKYGIQRFPEISRIVDRDYLLVKKINQVNIYVLRDKARQFNTKTL